jgi:hypothetical protein
MVEDPCLNFLKENYREGEKKEFVEILCDSYNL